MSFKLFMNAVIKMIAGVVLTGLLIFLPAGTLMFLQGWILILVLFIPMFIAGIVMMFKCPELLKLRLDAKEKQKEQSFIIKLSAIMFAAGFIVAGLDFRYKLSDMPKSFTIVAIFVFISAYLMYAEVVRENKFLSRTIEVQEKQTVVSAGLYSLVRHPMYLSTVLLFLSMPVILGSFWAFLIFSIYPFIIVKRIRYEELFLEQELKGYKDYKQKVKYRLIPYIW